MSQSLMHSKAKRVVSTFFLLLSANISGVYFAEASFKSSVGKPLSEPSQDSSHNEVLDPEENPKFSEEHHYYLPKQTTYGSSGASSYGASFTSPPHLTISPSSAQVTYEEITYEADLEEEAFTDDYITPYLSYCVSDTPSNDEIQSKLLVPSEEQMQKSVVLAGHIEIPSKTSSNDEASAVASESSVPLQGTMIYMQSSTDI